jgi:hypothetical protein
VWTDPLVVSVDTTSIRTLATRMTARVMWEYEDAQKTQDKSPALYKSMIGLVVFDCATERFGGAGGVSYSEDGGGGEVVSKYSISPEDAALSSPAPGTIAGDLLKFVCKQAKKSAVNN